MNLIDWKCDLGTVFYRRSGKTVLYLGEERQGGHAMVYESYEQQLLSASTWYQKLSGESVTTAILTKKNLPKLRPGTDTKRNSNNIGRTHKEYMLELQNELRLKMLAAVESWGFS